MVEETQKQKYTQQITSSFDFIPHNESEKAILQQRANDIAQLTQKHTDRSIEFYMRIVIGDSEKYGIPYRYMIEVINDQRLAKVPCSPHHIAGVIPRAGKLMTVLRLHTFFGITASKQNSRFIIVVSCNEVDVGLLVDDVIGKREYIGHELSPALPTKKSYKQSYISGIHNGQVTMLDIPSILMDPEIIVNS